MARVSIWRGRERRPIFPARMGEGVLEDCWASIVFPRSVMGIQSRRMGDSRSKF